MSLQKYSGSLVKAVLIHRWPYRGLIILCSFASAVFWLAAPYFQKNFVDRLLGVPRSALVPDWLWARSPLEILVGAFLLIILGLLVSQLGTWLGYRESAEIQRLLSEELYEKMLHLKVGELGRRQLGEIVSLFAVDVPGATVIMEQTLPSGASILFPLLLAPSFVHVLFGIPLLPIVAVLLSVVALNFFLSWRQARFFVKFKQLAGERTGLISEWLQNIRVLRILGWMERFEAKILSKRIEETHNRVAMVTNGQVMSSFASSVSFIANLVGVWILLKIRGDQVTAGELLALLWIFGVFLARAFRMLPWFFTFGMDSMTSLRRLENFLRSPGGDLPTEAGSFPAETDAVGLGLEVEGLRLFYGESAILKDLEFSIRPGELVAIVGEVGSGKSQLLLSLMGETNATFRKYRVGGQQALAWTPQERRRRFSYVPQEGFVMSSTLRENVVFEYEAPKDFDKEVHESLRLAQFDVQMENLPAGLDTEIGERGVNLSGGQRQRVSLARSDFFGRPIFLLDDCLSAVDVDTERKLLNALLSGAWRGHTRILVTHRLSILRKVDRVFFMKDGALMGRGTFAELSAALPEFRDFVRTVDSDMGDA